MEIIFSIMTNDLDSFIQEAKLDKRTVLIEKGEERMTNEKRSQSFHLEVSRIYWIGNGNF